MNRIHGDFLKTDAGPALISLAVQPVGCSGNRHLAHYTRGRGGTKVGNACYYRQYDGSRSNEIVYLYMPYALQSYSRWKQIYFSLITSVCPPSRSAGEKKGRQTGGVIELTS